MPKYFALLRSKLPVLAAVAAVVAALCLGVHWYGSLYAAWGMFRFHPLTPLFADTRTITHSIDCLLSGQEPYIVRNFDPWRRVYNYPPIWLDARYLGITSRSSNCIGAAMCLATACTVLRLFNSRTWISAIIIFFAVISRSVLFGVERGNTDQIIFFLLVFGFFLIERQTSGLKQNLRGLLIVLLTILKIYPAAASAIFLRHRKGLLRALITGIIAVAALILTTGRYLPIILRNTPRDSALSFGAYPFFLAMSPHVIHFASHIIQDSQKNLPIGAIVVGGIAMVFGAVYGGRLHRFLPPLDRDGAKESIAIAGLAIFCLAFIPGSSYDYRLLFLLGPLAYLVEDIDQRKSLRSLPAAVLILVLLWKSPELSPTFEIFDGLVFVMASAWLGDTLLSRKRTRENMTLARPEAIEAT